jgi:hypothetical protein
MRFRDEVIASYLDDEWRTPPVVHRLLGDRGTVADIASALERLARAGKIEAKHEAVMAPRYRDKAGPPVLCIDFYRKLQRRTPQHGDEGAGARHPIAKPSRTAPHYATAFFKFSADSLPRFMTTSKLTFAPSAKPPFRSPFHISLSR